MLTLFEHDTDVDDGVSLTIEETSVFGQWTLRMSIKVDTSTQCVYLGERDASRLVSQVKHLARKHHDDDTRPISIGPTREIPVITDDT
jgi:hypothetical protein